jgi:copper homeostasis protein
MRDEPRHILLEVCVGSVADVETAVAAGADRLELCGGLELGGLTPSIGLVENALSVCPVPVVVMLRPRAGGFCYDRHEFAAMLRDAEHFLDLGVSGIVFGILRRDGAIDRALCAELVERAGRRQTVFHRAFDFVQRQYEAFDVLADLGCTRVLTSGGKPTAAQGVDMLHELNARAAGRIEIMPGGGIRAENVVEIVRTTGCSQVHIGAAAPATDVSMADSAAIELCDTRCLRGGRFRTVCGEAVAGTKDALQGIA